jgi:hypothetical protein
MQLVYSCPKTFVTNVGLIIDSLVSYRHTKLGLNVLTTCLISSCLAELFSPLTFQDNSVALGRTIHGNERVTTIVVETRMQS